VTDNITAICRGLFYAGINPNEERDLFMASRLTDIDPRVIQETIRRFYKRIKERENKDG